MSLAPRRIVLLIDSLCQGGAQRQMTTLAILLHQRGHQIEVVIYHPLMFFEPELEEAGVRVTLIQKRSKPARLAAVRRHIRQRKPEVVIAFLATPSIMADLSAFPRRRFAVIVSERTGVGPEPRKGDRVRFQLHRLADAVVANGQNLADYVTRMAPWLEKKVHVIVNSVDLARYHPAPEPVGQVLRIAVLARIAHDKNPMRVLEAMVLFRKRRPHIPVSLDWYGNHLLSEGKPTPEWTALQEGITAAGLDGVFRTHLPVTDVVPLYQQASLILLASQWEGCPNVVCEAMACGRPVIASRVCDNHRLVHEGENGFLFDPTSSEDLAETLVRFAELSPEARTLMGQRSRALAETLLAPERLVDQYEALIAGI